MTKYFYFVLIAIYIGIIVMWGMRYPISYKIVGLKPDLIEERSLTNEEYYAKKKTATIRQSFNELLLYGSLMMFVISFFYSKKQFVNNINIPKIFIAISGVIAFVLLLVKSIGFIPGPGIR